MIVWYKISSVVDREHYPRCKARSLLLDEVGGKAEETMRNTKHEFFTDLMCKAFHADSGNLTDKNRQPAEK